MKQIGKKVILYLSVTIFVFLTACSSFFRAEAAENIISGKKARIIVESFSISQEAVVPGEEFELKLNVKNASDTAPVKSVLMTFSNDVQSVFTVYGQSDQVYIEDIAPKQVREVTLKLKAAENLVDTSVKFTLDFVYEDQVSSENQNKSSIQLPVTTTSKFEIQNVSFPDKVYAGGKTRMRITYKNTGADDFYNITMNVTSNGGEDTEQYSLGSLVAGKVSYAEMYISLINSGEQDVVISFSYEDIEGNKFATGEFNQKVTAVEGETQKDHVEESPQGTVAKSYDLYLLLVGVAAMAAVIFTLYRRYEG